MWPTRPCFSFRLLNFSGLFRLFIFILNFSSFLPPVSCLFPLEPLEEFFSIYTTVELVACQRTYRLLVLTSLLSSRVLYLILFPTILFTSLRRPWCNRNDDHGMSTPIIYLSLSSDGEELRWWCPYSSLYALSLWPATFDTLMVMGFDPPRGLPPLLIAFFFFFLGSPRR